MGELIRKVIRFSAIFSLAVLMACGSDAPIEDTPEGVTPEEVTPETPEIVDQPEGDGELIEVESNLDNVSTISLAGVREALLAPNEVFLEIGAGVDVDENGRAILRFADLLTVEVLRDGELIIQEVGIDEQAAVVAVLQNGGTFLNDFNAEKQIERRFTIETEFATITSTGTSFLVVSETDSPLEWIVGLDAVGDDLQITADGVTKSVATGVARWVAPIGEPSPGISPTMADVNTWVADVQRGVSVNEVGEVVWPAADVVANTGGLTAVPPIGTPFNLGTDVELTLLPATSANGGYRLEDCNRDGLPDIAMRDGALHFDFREVGGRTRALDVSVFNRSDSFAGELRLQDPGTEDIWSQAVTAAQGEGEIVSARLDVLPFHYAELTLTDGCFLGFSLTPPDPAGNPGAPRAAITSDSAGLHGRAPENGSLVAWPVGADGFEVEMRIDNETSDWLTLDRWLGGRSGSGWYQLEHIVYDTNCAFVTSEFATDLAAFVRFAYDEEYLYAAFQVSDDFYKGYSGVDQSFYLGDSPQLLLDLDLNGDLTDSQNSDDDIQLDFHPRLLRAEAAAGTAPTALWRLHTNPPTATFLWDAQTTAIPTQSADGFGYFLETAVPWSALGVAPQAGQVLGLAASVSDDDSEAGNDQECMISTAANRDWRNPTTWGTLLLASVP